MSPMDMRNLCAGEWLLAAYQPIRISCNMQVAYAGISTVVFIAYYLPELYKWIQSETIMPPGAICTSKQDVLGSQPTAEAAAGAELRRRHLLGVYQFLPFAAPSPLVSAAAHPSPPLICPPTLLSLRAPFSAAPTSHLLPNLRSSCVVAPATWLI